MIVSLPMFGDYYTNNLLSAIAQDDDVSAT